MATSRKAEGKKSRRAKPARLSIPGLSSRPVWQGNLQLSLVSCPVALYSATSRSEDISFHLLNPETHNRIRMVPTDPDTGPVDRAELVKGYEIEKNRYVVLTDEEIRAVRLETTRALAIERFVDAAEIDRLFWNAPYLILPADDESLDAYGVIREAMRETDRIALGRVVMHTRERLMGIEARGNGLVAFSLRMRNEVVDIDKIFETLPAARVDKNMVDIARKIIEQNEGEFAPSEFRDRYEEALRDVIEAKERGDKITAAPPPDTSNVVDLMEALKRSLARKGKAPETKGRGEPARTAHLAPRGKVRKAAHR